MSSNAEILPDGSSPLARGLLYLTRYDALYDRIIPARAGFTTRRVCSGSEWRDHPRSRGVYRGYRGP